MFLNNTSNTEEIFTEYSLPAIMPNNRVYMTTEERNRTISKLNSPFTLNNNNNIVYKKRPHQVYIENGVTIETKYPSYKKDTKFYRKFSYVPLFSLLLAGLIYISFYLSPVTFGNYCTSPEQSIIKFY